MNRLPLAIAFGLAMLTLPASAYAVVDPARAVAVGAAHRLEAAYVFPARARQAANLVRRNAAAGRYDGLRDDALADRVTRALRAVLHDKHVEMDYQRAVLPPEGTSRAPSPQQLAFALRRDREFGYGVARVALLPGNVGYLDLRFFADLNADTFAAIDAMVNTVGHADAVILDLRRNGGGEPKTIARFLSHFFPPKIHLNDFVGRGDGKASIQDSTYTSKVPGPRVIVPLYVLTASDTFSGGEECAYDVQTQKRGIVIGAVTGGGANPGSSRRIDDHFEIFVPDQRARNPITKTNWEGIGVLPDRKVAAKRALAVAYKLALYGKLSDTTLPPTYRSRLTRLRGRLDTMPDSEILAVRGNKCTSRQEPLPR